MKTPPDRRPARCAEAAAFTLVICFSDAQEYLPPVHPKQQQPHHEQYQRAVDQRHVCWAESLEEPRTKMDVEAAGAQRGPALCQPLWLRLFSGSNEIQHPVENARHPVILILIQI